MTQDASVYNLFDQVPRDLHEEVVDVLSRGRDCRVERIVSHGHASPPGFWYDQDEAEWVMVLRGAARLRLENPAVVVELGPGDSLDIAAHRRHRVEWTTPAEPTLWLALFYAPNTPSGTDSFRRSVVGGDEVGDAAP